jgi:hypothetical protein
VNPRRRYVVHVAGHDCAPVAERFGELEIRRVNGDTAIDGDRLDAAMLRGLLRELDRHGIELRSVTSHLADPAPA